MERPLPILIVITGNAITPFYAVIFDVRVNERSGDRSKTNAALALGSRNREAFQREPYFFIFEQKRCASASSLRSVPRLPTKESATGASVVGNGRLICGRPK